MDIFYHGNSCSSILAMPTACGPTVPSSLDSASFGRPVWQENANQASRCGLFSPQPSNILHSHCQTTLARSLSSALLPTFVSRAGSPTKIDYRKKLVPKKTNLSTGGPSWVYATGPSAEANPRSCPATEKDVAS